MEAIGNQHDHGRRDSLISAVEKFPRELKRTSSDLTGSVILLYTSIDLDNDFVSDFSSELDETDDMWMDEDDPYIFGFSVKLQLEKIKRIMKKAMNSDEGFSPVSTGYGSDVDSELSRDRRNLREAEIILHTELFSLSLQTLPDYLRRYRILIARKYYSLKWKSVEWMEFCQEILSSCIGKTVSTFMCYQNAFYALDYAKENARYIYK